MTAAALFLGADMRAVAVESGLKTDVPRSDDKVSSNGSRCYVMFAGSFLLPG
jgi:hypothetical protein